MKTLLSRKQAYFQPENNQKLSSLLHDHRFDSQALAAVEDQAIVSVECTERQCQKSERHVHFDMSQNQVFTIEKRVVSKKERRLNYLEAKRKKQQRRLRRCAGMKSRRGRK